MISDLFYWEDEPNAVWFLSKIETKIYILLIGWDCCLLFFHVWNLKSGNWINFQVERVNKQQQQIEEGHWMQKKLI